MGPLQSVVNEGTNEHRDKKDEKRSDDNDQHMAGESSVNHQQVTRSAHRDNGKRFVVHADEKLTAFLELELAIRGSTRLS
jgi:hypothetical protein